MHKGKDPPRGGSKWLPEVKPTSLPDDIFSLTQSNGPICSLLLSLMMIRSISSDFRPSLRWRSRPHHTHSLRPTRRRRFERQKCTRRAAVEAHQLATTVRRPGSVNCLCVRTRATGSTALLRPADRCFQKGYLVRIHRAWSHFLILSMCAHLADTHLVALPPSPTSPSPTQASSSALMLYMAKLVMLSFPIVNLAHVTSRFLIAFRHIPMTYPTSSPPLRTRVDAGDVVSIGHHFPLSRPLSAFDGRQDRTNRRAR